MIRPVSKVFVTRIHAPANNLCRIPCASLEVFVLVRSVSAKREIRLQLDDGTVGSSPMKAARVFMLTPTTELTEKQRKIYPHRTRQLAQQSKERSPTSTQNTIARGNS